MMMMMMLICFCPLDLDPKTLIHELYLIILKIYLQTWNERSRSWSRSRLWKLAHYKQTYTRPHSWVAINEEQNFDVQSVLFTTLHHTAALVYVCTCVLRALAIIVLRLRGGVTISLKRYDALPAASRLLLMRSVIRRWAATLITIRWKTRKDGNCDALQLEAARRRASRSRLFFFYQICTACAHKLLFPSFRSKFWQRL